jgi:glycosyltransferase involved in cell wall biosynthesis
MKILQLISSKGYFGAENVLVQLAAQLNKDKNFQPIAGVIENSATPHQEVADESRKKGIATAIFTCHGKFDLKMILQLRKYIKKEGVDIIHSHGYKSNLYSFFATIGLKKGLVATCHNWLGDNPKMKFYTALDLFFLRRFSHAVAVSPDVRHRMLQSGIPAEKVSTIGNGIDLARFENISPTNNVKAQLGIPERHTVVGTVGRLSQEKGHVHFLNTFKSIQAEFPDITYLIVGDGPLRGELQKKFDNPSIIFTGLRRDLPELYNCMDIFVLPSLTEGLPMVLLEAMASCLPVVATSVGSVPDVIVEEETGFFTQPGQEEALRDHLVFLLKNPEERRRMGQKGHARVKEGYSAAKMANEYKSVYLTALARKN